MARCYMAARLGLKLPKLIIRNLPWSIKEPDQLALLFRSYGKVKHVTLPRKKANAQAGFGFVVMRGRKNAEKALAGVNNKVVDGRTLAVDWAVEKEVWEEQQKAEESFHSEADSESPVASDENELHNEVHDISIGGESVASDV